MRRASIPDPLTAERMASWPLAATISVYLVAFAAMTSPWLLGRVSIPWDSKAHFLPQIQFLAQSIWAGELPWWNPYVFAGQPQIADPQSMIFSPPYIVLALLNSSPGPWAQDATLIATMAFGGTGLIVWFRDTRWHWAGAMIAALVFTFGAAMAWRIQHTGQVLSLAYLPWALLMVDRAVGRGSIVSGAAAGVFAAFIVLGRDQVALLGVYLLVARVIWLWLDHCRPLSRLMQSILPLAAGALLGLALVSIPVLMTVLLAADSNRPAIDFAGAGAGSLHPANLVTLVVPQVFGAAGDMADYWGPPSFAWVGTGLFTAQNVGQSYIGAIPLVFLVAATAAGRLWDRDIRFFTIVFAIMLLYGLGWYTPAFRLMYELPGISLYRRPADAVFLIGGTGAILAGYGAHIWFTEPWRLPTRKVLSAVLVVVLVAVVAAFAFAIMVDRVPRLGLPISLALISFGVAAAVLAWSRSRLALQPWHAAIAIVAVTAFDLGYNNGPSSSSSLAPSTFAMFEPDGRNAVVRALKSRVVNNETRRDRVELAGLGFHWPNASMTQRLENTLGYNPVRLGLYSRATGADDHVGLPDQRKFSPLFPAYDSLLADMLGLRWIATGAPVETMDMRSRPGGLELVEKVDQAFIYENKDTLPRIMFVASARAADFDAIMKSGRWPDFDPRGMVLLENVPPGPAIARGPGSARLISYGQTRIVIDAVSPDGGWVVLNDVWHSWWRAKIGSSPADLERANVLFRAVAVPAGRHTVVMEFRPLESVWGELEHRLGSRTTTPQEKRAGQ
jgi:hypothetical protein